MQHIEVMTTFVMALLAIGIILLFCARDKKTNIRNYPSPACQVMKWYESDYIILEREIENARNIYHLDHIREAIKEFKYRYKGYQESITLQIDVNISVLKENGFIEGGLNCRSGEMYFTEKKTKFQLVFGMRYNIGGKQRKYFSLSKDFESQENAILFFNELRVLLLSKK